MLWMEFVELAHKVDVGRVKIRNLSTRVSNSAFDLTDREFVKTYRLSKDLAKSLIEEISPSMPVCLRSDGIDTETKILVALAFYASGSYQTLVGQKRCHTVSQPSVSRAINQVTDVLNLPHIFNKYVKFPRSQEERDEVKRGFYRKFGMSGVLGCIDGTHVAIVPPKRNEHEERFINRKGYHSLNTLIICDSDARIMCVDSSNPGSTHDSSAWNNNPLKEILDEIVRTTGEDFYLLGDSGFPLRRVMMTPILNAAPNTPEALYTEKHVTTRNVVERCIGILSEVDRFRCLLLDRKLHYRPTVAAKVINACCVLHNATLHCNVDIEDTDRELLDEEQEQRARDAHDDAVQLRENRRTRRPNDLLQQGRNYQHGLVQRLWNTRQINLLFQVGKGSW